MLVSRVGGRVFFLLLKSAGRIFSLGRALKA